MIEPDPQLEAFAIKHKKSRARIRPIPSVCPECSDEFPSKTALDEHERLLHPKEPPFNDAKRAEFLALLTKNVRFFKACTAVHISPSTVKRAMRVDPSFAEAVELAEEEAAERAEELLWEQAEGGNLTAVIKILDKRQAKRWADAAKTLNVNVQGVITHNAELLPHQNKVAELAARARERMALNGTPEIRELAPIDVEIVAE